MASSQYIPSPLPPCSHYDQPGIIVPPPTTSSMSENGQEYSSSSSPCSECMALHSTILHSMAFSMPTMDYSACQHLHASSSCSSCYSRHQLQQQGHAPFSQGHHNRFYHNQSNFDPYSQREESQTTQSYPNLHYHDWSHQGVSNNGGSFLPPPPEIAPPHSENSSYSTSAPLSIISLPSPTLSIPPITPFLPNTDTQLKSYDMPPQTNVIQRGNNTNYTETIQQHGSHQNGLQSVHPPEIRISPSASMDPLNDLSSMTLTDRDVKRELTAERPESNKRKIQRTPSDRRKSRDGEKKGSEVRKRQPEDLCQVCGDRASGYHYNALTCEGCKGFFRRSITNKTTYKQGCKQGGNCEMDTYTRRKCPQCRLKKCKEVGMLEECLLTEIQCQSKRRRRKQKQERVSEEMKLDETSQTPPVTSPCHSSVASSPSGSDISQNGDGGICLILTDEEGRLIDTVAEAFKSYNINPEIVKRWEKYINNESNTTCRLSDVTTVHVQVLVEYAKNLPGFITLDPEDQIALLKGSVFEAMLLRNSCGYHHLMRRDNKTAIIDELGIEAKKFEALLDFFACIGKLLMDETEYSLLIAIVIFNSDYPYVKNKAVVEEYQDLYLSALAKYSLTREPTRPSVFAKILAMLTEIRSLSHFNAEIVTSWKKRGALTPLLCEIWDLD